MRWQWMQTDQGGTRRLANRQGELSHQLLAIGCIESQGAAFNRQFNARSDLNQTHPRNPVNAFQQLLWK
jgi:hypothetical protein